MWQWQHDPDLVAWDAELTADPHAHTPWAGLPELARPAAASEDGSLVRGIGCAFALMVVGISLAVVLAAIVGGAL